VKCTNEVHLSCKNVAGWYILTGIGAQTRIGVVTLVGPEDQVDCRRQRSETVHWKERTAEAIALGNELW
jgi:hypothetical protein